MPAAAECVEYVQQYFTWERVARQVLTIYKSAFRAKHGEP